MHDMDSIYYIPEETGKMGIKVTQRFQAMRAREDGLPGRSLKTMTRVSRIIIPIGEAIRYKHGQVLAGNILIHERLSPFDDDDPTLYLLWDDYGNVVRVDGNAVWQLVFYCEDPEEVDQLIVTMV